MSKTTKALAILGVVAGLGVATLPLGAYATNTTGTTPANNNVKTEQADAIEYNTSPVDGDDDTAYGDLTVKTNVQAFISLTIKGNIDETGDDGHGNTVVKKNVVQLGQNGGSTTDDKFVSYGILSTGDATLNVKSNGEGYTLSIAEATTAGHDNGNTMLKDGVAKADKVDGETAIPAGVPTRGESAWGFTVEDTDARVDNSGTPVSGAASVYTDGAYSYLGDANNTTGLLVTSEGSTVDDGEDTKVKFGVTVGAAQQAGEYSEVVTITATPTVN